MKKVKNIKWHAYFDDPFYEMTDEEVDAINKLIRDIINGEVEVKDLEEAYINEEGDGSIA